MIDARLSTYRVRRNSKSVTITMPLSEALRLERTIDWAEQRGHEYLFGRDFLRDGFSHGDNLRVLGCALAKGK